MIFKNKIVFRIGLVLLLAVVVAGGMRWKLKQGRFTPPPAGESILDREVTQADELPAGFIVWSSNRFGNHDILRMDLPGREITQLTTHPHTEFYPRVSPDGRYVVFARSHIPWVSQRKQAPWDVILLDLQSGEERMLAKNANMPTWSQDSEKVYFIRDLIEFTQIDIKSGKEKLLYKSGEGDISHKTILQTPHLSPDKKKMSVTLRGRQHRIGIADLNGKFKEIADGCQLYWSKDGSFLYFVDYGGKQKNAFFIYEPDKDKKTMWLDLPGDFSHEYFPKLSQQEDYLIFASSTGGHEHDSADYEIFLWQVGAPAESATRLTFHTGNDNWPDVYLQATPASG